MPSWTEDRPRLEEMARRIHPSIRLYTKEESFLPKLLGKLLCLFVTIFTLGFKSYDYEGFMKRFAQGIGPWHFYPKEWTAWQVESTLPHEGQHTRQGLYCGFGIHPAVGLPIWGLLYLLGLLPIGLAIFRFIFELDADIAGWKHMRELNIAPDYIRFRADQRAASVCGPAYLFSIPKPIGLKIYRWAVNKVLNG